MCNLALAHLEQSEIDGIDDPQNNVEVQCAKLYHHVRRLTLESHLWNFALKRSLLSSSGTPDFEYEAQFTLPSDFLRLSRVGRYPATDIDHVIEGGYILVNDFDATDPLPVVYVWDITAVGNFSQHFVELFSLELAIRLEPLITSRADKQADLISKRNFWAKKAFSVDGQQSKPKVAFKSELLNARGKIGSI